VTIPITILRLPAVRIRCGLSRSSIYLKIANGDFPRPISLGARAVGWIASEIDSWLAGRFTLSRRAAVDAETKVARTERASAAKGRAGSPVSEAEAKCN
jgi:prophage regulatory protein